MIHPDVLLRGVSSGRSSLTTRSEPKPSSGRDDRWVGGRLNRGQIGSTRTMTAVLDISAPQQALASKPSLAGLGRAGLKAALASIGVPDKQLNMRVGQLWSWIYARGATSFDQMSNVSKDVRAPVAGGLHARAARDRHRAGVDRRHAQVAAAAAAARTRGARAGDRDGLHPRGRSRHAVHLEPGRLHADLLVLSHRHAEAGAQPAAGRDRRADPAGARPHRRLAGRGGAGRRRTHSRRAERSPTSC